jgi:hypothetical protein
MGSINLIIRAASGADLLPHPVWQAQQRRILMRASASRQARS